MHLARKKISTHLSLSPIAAMCWMAAALCCCVWGAFAQAPTPKPVAETPPPKIPDIPVAVLQQSALLYAQPDFFSASPTALLPGTPLQIIRHIPGWVWIQSPGTPTQGWLPLRDINHQFLLKPLQGEASPAPGAHFIFAQADHIDRFDLAAGKLTQIHKAPGPIVALLRLPSGGFVYGVDQGADKSPAYFLLTDLSAPPQPMPLPALGNFENLSIVKKPVPKQVLPPTLDSQGRITLPMISTWTLDNNAATPAFFDTTGDGQPDTDTITIQDGALVWDAGTFTYTRNSTPFPGDTRNFISTPAECRIEGVSFEAQLEHDGALEKSIFKRDAAGTLTKFYDGDATHIAPTCGASTVTLYNAQHKSSVAVASNDGKILLGPAVCEDIQFTSDGQFIVMPDHCLLPEDKDPRKGYVLWFTNGKQIRLPDVARDCIIFVPGTP